MSDINVRAAAVDERQSLQERHHSERRNQRIKAQITDDSAVDEANDPANRDHSQRGRTGTNAPMQFDRDVAQERQRTDRQVDSSGHHHEGRAKRHNSNQGGLAEHLRHIVRFDHCRGKGGDDAKHDEEDGRDAKPRRLRAKSLRRGTECCGSPAPQPSCQP
jgi:septal ring factor EnvC (AmiA/AmiB activator)